MIVDRTLTLQYIYNVFYWVAGSSTSEIAMLTYQQAHKHRQSVPRTLKLPRKAEMPLESLIALPLLFLDRRSVYGSLAERIWCVMFKVL